MRSNQTPRRGIVAVLVAVCLTVLIGCVALAIDGGLLMDSRRRVQAAADTGALAAASTLFANWQTTQGLDPNGSAAGAASTIAAANGFPNPQVNIPPLSGDF